MNGVNPSLIEKVRTNLQKRAAMRKKSFVPMGPGGPEMAMAGATPMPQEAAMAGMPPQGAPMPPDPAMAGGPPPGQPVTMNLEDLVQLFQAIQSQGGAAGAGAPMPTVPEEQAPKKPSTAGKLDEISAKLDQLIEILAQMLGGGGGEAAGAPPMPPEAAPMGGAAPMPPEMMGAPAGAPPMPAPPPPMPPEAMPMGGAAPMPPGMQVQASHGRALAATIVRILANR